ncbi:bacteriohemerythrin [Comamonas terrigena]|jgi:hemerythrin-like metal-binding protein|uniref:bacteriohemerythrin n=1 Tax=Comamonas terrigena TaxID=32013 RepID=UPI0028AABEC6|nr:bacteriohemerythrin [Comamonas terrigena]
MAYFEWADDMVIDGGPIDADHRLLVDLVNELHTATREGQGRAVVASILHRVITSTQDHLRNEEHLMAQMGFPDLDNHKIGHNHFMDQLWDLEKKLQAGSITVAAQLSAVLRDWLSLHIRRNDKELLRFQRRKAREQARAAAGTKAPLQAPAKPSQAAAAPGAALAKPVTKV